MPGGAFAACLRWIADPTDPRIVPPHREDAIFARVRVRRCCGVNCGLGDDSAAVANIHAPKLQLAAV